MKSQGDKQKKCTLGHNYGFTKGVDILVGNPRNKFKCIVCGFEDKQKKVDETFKHWGYGSGIEQTAVSAKGTTLNLDDMNSPKDYLTDRVDKILKVYGGHVYLGNISQSKQVALDELVALLEDEKKKWMEEVEEKVEKMIKTTNNLRLAKVDGKDDWNNALEQSACKMDALEKDVRKALTGMKEEGRKL